MPLIIAKVPYHGKGLSKLMKPMYRDREEYPDELKKMKIDLACALNDKRKVYFIP